MPDTSSGQVPALSGDTSRAMTPERFQRVEALYHRALDKPAADRVRFVAEHCGGDGELRAEVESLLEADAQAAQFLAVPATHVAAGLLAGTPETPPDIPIPAGERIGPYRVVRKIGSGGMGHVYLAEDLRLGRKVALKCLQGDIAVNTRGLARLEQEARAASALNHPNIITVYDLIESAGRSFIAAEYIEGETLREHTAGRRLPVEEIADIGAQVAQALAAAHAAGIVHGDIKPANVMVRSDGLVKVLDFGLARQSTPAEAPAVSAGGESTAMGTLLYMSPEQLLRRPVDARTDIFSLGVVLYELAAGRTPFRGETDAAVSYALLKETPDGLRDVRPDVPERFAQVVARALEKAPDRRYQRVVDLADDLRALARSPSTVRRTRTAWPAAAAVVLGLGAAGVFWFTQPAPAPRVSRIAQVTGDPGGKQYFVDDGATLYYARGNEDPDATVLRVNVAGGEATVMPQFTGMFPLDISPDGAELLLGQFLHGTANGPYPLWVASPSGAPSRLGELTADSARWSPDRREIAYAKGSELRIARRDGSASRRLVTMDGLVQRPVWSPDGRAIRFTLFAKNANSLWEVATDGRGVQTVLPTWADRSNGNGVWTADGSYFVFAALDDLWTVPGDDRGVGAGPVRLTHGPFRARLPRAAADGRRIFFVGLMNRGELTRYDRKGDRWLPYLSGLAGVQLAYSRDGEWITWVSYPEGTVWRSRLDGSDRLELTRPPIRAVLPLWSPDGRTIAFFGGEPGKPTHVYVVPASGGQLRQLTRGEGGPAGEVDHTWSPDGRLLAFSSSSLDTGRGTGLRVVDVTTGRVSTLPASDGLLSPRWSPDGRYIVALASPPVPQLWLYDVATHARTRLTESGAGWPSWSRDSRYVYFEDNAASTWYRVRVSGRTSERKVERLASLKDLTMAPSTFGWVGVTPDGDLISTRDTGSSQIYALDWEAR